MIFKELLENSGITHIEDLPLHKFLEVVRKFNQYYITEKVDGSEILFGIDESGFYTSRETKGGRRIYNSEDYPLNFSTTYMRSVHEALEQVLPSLEEAGLKIGDQVEAEVLFGEIPNAIPYSKDINHIIFLRTTEGFVKTERLKNALLNEKIEVCIPTPYTVDGRKIQIKEETNIWQFSQVPNISVDYINLQNELDEVCEVLEMYLRDSSGIERFSNYVIECLPMNKCPGWVKPEDWKFIKEDVKQTKIKIQAYIYEELIPDIKKVLLKHLVSTQSSAFGPPREDGGWIEGVVLRHCVTNEQIKIVDKEVFTKVRNFLWEERISLTEKSYYTEETKSFLGNLLVGLGSSVGHPELGTKQAKRYIKLLGESKEEVMTALSNGVRFNETKDFWINFLNGKERILEKRLQEYENTKNEKNINVTIVGKKRVFVYNETIDRRTKQVFAEMFKQIDILREGALNANNIEGLISLLIKK